MFKIQDGVAIIENLNWKSLENFLTESNDPNDYASVKKSLKINSQTVFVLRSQPRSQGFSKFVPGALLWQFPAIS